MKKFFSLSAIVAVLAMLMTSVSVSSCSSDDDDDAKGDTTTFTVDLGGTKATTAGSFLSIKNKAAYLASADSSLLKSVEIVFNGTQFVSAKSSANKIVAKNGLSATISAGSVANTYAYTTSDGFSGTITIVEGTAESTSSVIKVSVIRISK
jgi:hypothetical protein